MTQKTILIVGGSGFIGSHLEKELSAHKVINMDLVEPKFDALSIFKHGDIRNKNDIQSVLEEFNVDLIINLAAEHKDFGVEREEYFATNEHGMKNLLEAAGDKGINDIVFYSSVAVYGDNPVPSEESTQPNPSNDYGASKLAAEKVIESWVGADEMRKVLVIRPAVVYGERNTANVYRLIKQVDSGLYFNVGKADNIKSMAYVKNLVAATVFLAERMIVGIDVYNYADQPHMNVRQIGDTIASALGKRGPITLPYSLLYLAALPFDLLIRISGRDLPISTNRVRKLSTATQHLANKVLQAGYEPKFTNEQGIKNMISWMRTL